MSSVRDREAKSEPPKRIRTREVLSRRAARTLDSGNFRSPPLQAVQCVQAPIGPGHSGLWCAHELVIPDAAISV